MSCVFYRSLAFLLKDHYKIFSGKALNLMWKNTWVLD